MKAGLFLLPLLLCGCRSPEPESALARQVTALEARIAALDGHGERLANPASVAPDWD